MADVQRYFKTVTLDFGKRNWYSASRVLELSPEGYLIVSVSRHMFPAFERTHYSSVRFFRITQCRL